MWIGLEMPLSERKPTNMTDMKTIYPAELSRLSKGMSAISWNTNSFYYCDQ